MMTALLSRPSWVLAADATAVLLVLAAWVLAASSYQHLPEQIPTHFGITGRPDGWGPRVMVFFLPALQTVILTFMIMADLGKPAGDQADVLPLVRLGTTLLLSYLLWATVQTSLGRQEGLGIWLLPATLLPVAGLLLWKWLA